MTQTAEMLMGSDGEPSELDAARTLMPNRRAAFRLPVALDLLVDVPAGTFGSRTWECGREGPHLETVTEDLSVGGLRFRAPERLEREAPVNLALEIEGISLALAATVMQTTVDSFGAAVGAKFTDIEGQPALSQLSRFLFDRERRRLPRVSLMYPVRCSAGDTDRAVEGTTQECSPGFAWLLLESPGEPGRHVTVRVRVGKSGLSMRGRIVTCGKIADLWRTGVEFDDILPRWRDVIIERRSGRR